MFVPAVQSTPAPEGSENPSTAPVEGTEPNASTDPAGGTGPNAPEGGAANQEDTLPGWARAELGRARSEAASYRTQLRTAQEQLSHALTQEDVADALAPVQQQLAQAERTNLLFRVAGDIPATFHSLLTGETEAEIAASAEALRPQLNIPGSLPAPRDGAEPSGGLSPQGGGMDSNLQGTPAEIAARVKQLLGR